MDTYTSQQARAMLHADAKTFLRWLEKAGIQPQISKADNRVKLFTLEQLQHLAREHERVLDIRVVEEEPQVTIADLVEQLRDLRHEVDMLKRHMALQDEQIKALSARPIAKEVRAPKTPELPPQSQKRLSQGKAYLPDGLVPWRGFAEAHGISASTMQKAIKSGRLPVIRGSWIMAREAGANIVMGALDAVGRARFYELYHANSHFKPCEQCPH